MSRELKFRCWDKFNAEMFYTLTDLTDFFNKVAFYEAGGNDMDIMQYTRLKDKNGNGIYEGDIIEHSDAAWRAKVEWCESGKWILNYIAMGREVLLSDRTDYIIVIGNIYENSNLLENGE